MSDVTEYTALPASSDSPAPSVLLVLALLLTGFERPTAFTGAVLGALVWLGPAASIGMTGHIANGKPIGLFAIDTTCQLIYLVLMGALLGGWR